MVCWSSFPLESGSHSTPAHLIHLKSDFIQLGINHVSYNPLDMSLQSFAQCRANFFLDHQSLVQSAVLRSKNPWETDRFRDEFR